jgi:hypothetical protein
MSTYKYGNGEIVVNKGEVTRFTYSDNNGGYWWDIAEDKRDMYPDTKMDLWRSIRVISPVDYKKFELEISSDFLKKLNDEVYEYDLKEKKETETHRKESYQKELEKLKKQYGDVLKN